MRALDDEASSLTPLLSLALSVGGGPPIIECDGSIAGVWVGCEVMRLLGDDFGYTVMQTVVSVLVATAIVLLSWNAEKSKRRS